MPSSLTLCPLYWGGNDGGRGPVFPRDREQIGSLCRGSVCPQGFWVASVTRQEVKRLFQAPSSQLLASRLPPTPLRFLDCSALSVLGIRWILGVSREGGREQDLGRGERAGQMSGPLLISPPPATPARCSLEASGFMTMTRLWSLGVPDKLGQMSQSRYFIYSRSPKELLLSQSLHSPLSL